MAAASVLDFRRPAYMSWSTRYGSFISHTMERLESIAGRIADVYHKVLPRIGHCWATVPQVSTGIWLSLLVALVVGPLGVRYAYQAMSLAQWTARKDFLESCRQARVWNDYKRVESKILTMYDRARTQLLVATASGPWSIRFPHLHS